MKNFKTGTVTVTNQLGSVECVKEIINSIQIVRGDAVTFYFIIKKDTGGPTYSAFGFLYTSPSDGSKHGNLHLESSGLTMMFRITNNEALKV